MTESYRIVQLPNGTWGVHSLEDSETMHPGLGPGEAELLYVRQLRIPERARDTTGPLVIWDVGLGAAANALTGISACAGIRSELYVMSFDCTVEPLRFALTHADKLPYLHEYVPTLQRLMADGQAQFHKGTAKITWQLALGDFPTLLRHQGDAWCKPHAIFFDPFSPGKNPAMWTEDLFAALFQRLSDDRPCGLATYSRSTMIRAAMLLAGFFVGRGRSSGRKEETTIAANRTQLIDELLDRRWLERARRSDSAEPLRAGLYRQAPLTDRTYLRLAAHQQFRQP